MSGNVPDNLTALTSLSDEEMTKEYGFDLAELTTFAVNEFTDQAHHDRVQACVNSLTGEKKELIDAWTAYILAPTTEEERAFIDELKKKKRVSTS